MRAGFLIAKPDDEETVRDWIAGDPHAVHGLAAEMTVTAWDPIFGAFAEESSFAAGAKICEDNWRDDRTVASPAG